MRAGLADGSQGIIVNVDTHHDRLGVKPRKLEYGRRLQWSDDVSFDFVSSPPLVFKVCVYT